MPLQYALAKYGTDEQIINAINEGLVTPEQIIEASIIIEKEAAIKQPETYVDNAGILRVAPISLPTYTPDLTPAPIYVAPAPEPVYVAPAPESVYVPTSEIAYTDSEAYQQEMSNAAMLASLQKPYTQYTPEPEPKPVYSDSGINLSALGINPNNNVPVQQYVPNTNIPIPTTIPQYLIDAGVTTEAEMEAIFAAQREADAAEVARREQLALADSEAYQQEMRNAALLAALQSPTVTTMPVDLKPFDGSISSPTIVNETPQVQFMGMDEFIAISDEGIVIPQDSNLVVIPISEIKEPELFNVVLEAKLAEPEKPVIDIIISEVVQPLAEIPREENQPLVESPDEVKNIILFQNEVVELKTENPGLTIVEATLIAAETTQPSETAVEEVCKKVEEIVTEQQNNGISNTVSQQDNAKKKLDKKVYELSWLDKIVEYIYNNFYTQN